MTTLGRPRAYLQSRQLAGSNVDPEVGRFYNRQRDIHRRFGGPSRQMYNLPELARFPPLELLAVH